MNKIMQRLLLEALCSEDNDTQLLEDGADEINRLIQQRDKLLDALKRYQLIGYGNSMDFRLQAEAYDLAVPLIAEIEANK